MIFGLWFLVGYNLNFNLNWFVMNCYFYGKLYVLDVKVLNFEVVNVLGVLYRLYRIEEIQVWEVKIINDEFYVKGISIFM